MKHLLIILSFLLLSSPVIGGNHKGETLYGWGNTLPYVWKGVGDKETQPRLQMRCYTLAWLRCMSLKSLKSKGGGRTQAPPIDT